MSKEIFWAVLELSAGGEKEENPNLIKKDLTSILPNLEIFIPTHWNEDEQFQRRIELMQGYIFATGAETSKHYFLLESSKYITAVLSYKSKNGREPELVPNSEIENLKAQLNTKIEKDFEINDTVKFLDGQFKNLTGKIISILDDKEVDVVVLGLKSADFIVRIQKVYLDKLDVIDE